MRRFLVVFALLTLGGCGSFQGSYNGSASMSGTMFPQAQNYSVTLQLAQSGSTASGTMILSPQANSSQPGAAPQQPLTEGFTGTASGNTITVSITSLSTNVIGACQAPMTGTLIMNGNQMSGTVVCSNPSMTQTITLNKIN
ncbi:MAG: hypothetical protein HYR96_10995 [Deltaproteobacteria bacterium]|nr:hypothetical protein [Deltaproteobacteria bacterium]MBI3293969.1 hypothetical protein [Deltaproteobacteria bacterium]